MNFNADKKIDLQTAFVLADKILSRRSPKANFLLNLGIEKSRGKYLKLCFSYLRWADDIVDNPQITVLDKRIFINRQLKLISDYANNIFIPIEKTEETFLYYFIQYALSIENTIIINSVGLMVEALEMDVRRTEGEGIFSESEMRTYIYKMSKAFFDVTSSFILPEGDYPYHNIVLTRASTKILMIRDLVEDIEHGYINITREQLDFYKLSISNLQHNNNLKLYFADEINTMFNILFDEAKIIKRFPMRVKLFNYYNQIYYLPKIFRLKTAGFNPFITANELSFVDITKVYLSTAFVCIKLFRIEFL